MALFDCVYVNHWLVLKRRDASIFFSHISVSHHKFDQCICCSPWYKRTDGLGAETKLLTYQAAFKTLVYVVVH